MTITIKLFALGRELTGKSELAIQLTPGDTVKQALDRLKADYSEFARLGSYMIAVNMEYADETRTLADGDEVAIIPPVSGG
ncbi:MAG: MoaD/ThiS family protein [Calditrichia bacterium]